MSSFKWNINFLIFFRLAWASQKLGYDMQGWKHVGRLYFTMQPNANFYYIKPKIEKVKKWLAKLDNSLL